MLISIFIILFFAGLILAVPIAILIVVSGKTKLKKIDRKIREFEQKSFNSPEEKEEAKILLKKELIQLKSKITNQTDRETASDKINLL